jgi:hypothetical protein
MNKFLYFLFSFSFAYNFRTAILNDDSLTISWSTNNSYLSKPIIFYGLSPDNLNETSTGFSIQYHQDSIHHHVPTHSLIQSSFYYLKTNHNPNIQQFLSNPNINAEKQLRIAIYGDMGIVNSNNTMESLKKRNIDLFLHIGDISYADDKSEIGNNPYYESTYNKFQESVSLFSNNRPYMVCPGNHDISCHSISDFGCDKNLRNFTAFNSRFKMPDNGSKNMWYSFNYGPIHFISINTETDYKNAPTTPNTIIGSGAGGGFGNQLKWLENDLKKVNRTERNWIIVYGHRPMYSKIIFDYPLDSKLRVRNAFEPIFIKYNVDIYFAGHIHAYERMYRIINGKKNDNGIYHIISGAAGSQEKVDSDDYLKHDYTAYYDYENFGYGELAIIDKNNLEWNFFDNNSKIIDNFIFEKK